ncbi:MAG TPA: M14-type cytosolic carboxypeptidase [Ignavibacteriales bacterium]|nr:M14-type cytosolic carboxypeptidase [Ignavibacteriales bacterium]
MKIFTIVLVLALQLIISAQVKFDANFESGNINSVTTTDSVNYTVTTNSTNDIGGRWFYFRITGAKNRHISVTIPSTDVNRPFYSYDNKEFYRFTMIESPRMNYFEKTFEQDTVYVSYYIPYNYSYLQERIKEWQKHSDVKVDTIGFTKHNLPLQMLTITDPNVSNSRKRAVWIHARTHPSETPGSWHLDGIISELLSNNEVVNYYKKNLIFYIVPFTNPDGVYYGKSRTNTDGVDVESNWGLPDGMASLEVLALRNKMKEINANHQLSVFLNIHSQAAKFATFWIHTASSTTADFYLRQNQFANLNTSDNPYFTKKDYSYSNIGYYFPEGWLYQNYGQSVMALTYETPYDQYSTGYWVTNASLFQIGQRTLYAIAEYLGISHPKHLQLDNSEAVVSGTTIADSTGLLFFGRNYLVLNKGTSKSSVTYHTETLPAGIYSVGGWWPSASGVSPNTKITMTANSDSLTVYKNQQKDGGQWNLLTDSLVLKSPALITIRVDNNETSYAASDAFRVVYKGEVTRVEEMPVPEDFALYQNYPNPFNPETTIRYNLLSGAFVRLTVYDILGKEVKVVEDGYKQKGMHEVHFSARGLSSGIYIYRLSAGSMSLSRKMLLLK